jgi:hypothetical protein
MRTTLNQIRTYGPCRDGWEKLLRRLGKTAADDEPLWIDTILDYNGLDDALWCLRAAEGCDREIRLYAVWCARRVQHLMTDPRSVAALDVAERHARGEASDKELNAARSLAAAAWAAAGRAAAAAACEAAESWAALWAAAGRAAAGGGAEWAECAARAAGMDRDTERAAQVEELRRICREMREAKP